MRIAISGATGLVGSELKKQLASRGDEAIAITRSPKGTEDIGWDPSQQKIDLAKLEGLDAVVHLAGDNIATGRWTNEKRARIRSSRVDATRFLAESLTELERPPQHFVAASAIGYYGDRGDEIMTESSTPGVGFLAETCIDWEAASQPLLDAGLPVAHGRIGVVMTTAGGMLEKMLTPFRLGFGAVIGTGNQYISWISRQDLAQALVWMVDQQAAGTFNLVSPNPVTNRDFTRTLAKALHRPAFLWIPSIAVRTGLGEMGEDIMLSSTRVLPNRLVESGFKFQYPTLAELLESEV